MASIGSKKSNKIKMKYILSLFARIDWFLIVLIAIMLVFSFLNIADVNTRSDLLLYRQIIVVLVGFSVLFLVSAIDYRYFKNFSGPVLGVYVLMVLFLIAVLFFAQVRGISAWINIFSTYSIQPSEFGKLAVLIILAKYFSSRHKEIYDWKHILVSGVYAGIPAGLTFLQPDFGSMVVYIVLWFAILFSSGIKKSHLALLIGLAVVGFAISWLFIFQPYQKSRIISFLNPYADSRGTGYNSLQSQATFGSGGLFGTYVNDVTNTAGEVVKLKPSVPEPFTDFAFAVFGQKFGFIGILAFISLLFALCFRIGKIASESRNNFIKLFGVGLIAIIGVHLVINIGMNLGVLPITGIPLPFLSYGGSHLTMIMLGLGIIQSYVVHG